MLTSDPETIEYSTESWTSPAAGSGRSSSTIASLLSSPNSVMTTLFILDMSSAVVNSADQYRGVGTSSGNQALTRWAFVGTNPTGELITSGLPVIRPGSMPSVEIASYNPTSRDRSARSAGHNLDSFRIADHPGVIAWWLKSKMPSIATSTSRALHVSVSPPSLRTIMTPTDGTDLWHKT